MWVYIGIIVAMFALLLLIRVKGREGFVDVAEVQRDLQAVNMGAIPEPQLLFQRLRGLLDKYDQPGVWAHAATVMDKDPSELARMHIREQMNKDSLSQ